MRKIFHICIATVLGASLLLAQTARTADIELKAAQHKAEVEGDLKGAIRQYGAIVAKYAKSNRSVAAMALVHMAECYQKAGDTEARKIYEQVVREYADQKEAVEVAQSRLGTPPGSSIGGSTRQVWAKTGGAPYGRISPDGRYVAFNAALQIGSQVPNVAVHDLTTGADLVLTRSEDVLDHPTQAKRAFSPDSKYIAYIWVTVRSGEERSELRISALKSDPSAKARVLFTTEDRLETDDWSPDGKWIALQIRRKDRTRQIGLVSTADGSLRVLKSIDWSGSSGVYFSPDSQYLAYDLPSGDSSEKHDVFVLAVDGSREVPAVIHPADDQVAGWTPDGKHLLFFSDRNGTRSLWWLRFDGGKTQGQAEMLRPNVGTNMTNYLGPTRSGDLCYIVLGGGVRVSVASLDLKSGQTAPESLQQFTAGIYPAWSSDGKLLAYSEYQMPAGQDLFLAIRSLETGQTRELRPEVKWPTWPSWSPDGGSLLVGGTDLKGRGGIFKIDTQTAEAQPIVLGGTDEAPVTPQWFPDGKRILYERAGQRGDSAIVERELASGRESEVVRIRVLRNQPSFTRSFVLSPDGRWLAYLTSDGEKAHTAIMLMPLAGRQPRELLKLNEIAFLGGWTPDGQALLYARSDAPPPPGWGLSRDVRGWIMPVNGGEPRKLDLGENFVSQLQMHPDGKRVVFWSNNQTAEQVWMLENYLPTLTARK